MKKKSPNSLFIKNCNILVFRVIKKILFIFSESFKEKKIIQFFFLFFILQGGSQLANAQIDDSLYQKYYSAKEDTVKALASYNMSFNFMSLNIDSCMFYAKKALYYSEKANFSRGQGLAHEAIGDAFVRCNNFDSANFHFEQALYFYALSNQKHRQIRIYLLLGNIATVNSIYPLGLEYFQQCIELSDSLQPNISQQHALMNTGEIYLQLNSPSKALPYFDKAYNFLSQSKDYNAFGTLLGHLMNVHYELGHDSLSQKYYNTALEVYDKLHDGIGKSVIINSMGRIYYQKGEYEKSLELYTASRLIYEDTTIYYDGPRVYLQIDNYSQIAKVQHKLNNLDSAFFYAQKAYTAGIQFKTYDVLADMSFILSDFYEKNNSPTIALQYYKEYKQYSDSVSNEEMLKNIVSVELEYEYEKKQKALELLQQKELAEKERRFLILSIFSVLLVFGIVIAGLLVVLQRNRMKHASLANKHLELESKHLKLEKVNLENELEFKNKELAANVMYLVQKNEFITMIAEKLLKSKDAFKKSNQDLVLEIIKQLQQNSNDTVWEEFELRFTQVHKDFYERLEKAYPELSPNERKLCAFLRLNMTTKEISAVTFQTPNSITVARSRLRKKLMIDRDDNLVAYLAQF